MRYFHTAPGRFFVGVLPVLLLPLLLVWCRSTFTNMDLLKEEKYVALFMLPAADYPSSSEIREQLPELRKMPEMTAEQVIDLLGNLKFQKKTFWGSPERRVYYHDELQFIAPTIADGLQNLKENQRLVIVSRFDNDRSVLSRMERVTVLVWADTAGLNLVFGELRYEIPFNEFIGDQDWTRVPPINMKTSYPFYALSPSPDYSLKKISGYTHKTWAVFKFENLKNLKYEPQKSAAALKKEQDQKMRILDNALKAGLITREEYREKIKRLRESEQGAEKKPVADERPAADEKPAAEKKPAADEKPAAEKKPAADEKPAVEKKPAADEKPAAEKKPATDEKPAADEKPATDEKPAADEKPATDEKPESDKKTEKE